MTAYFDRMPKLLYVASLSFSGVGTMMEIHKVIFEGTIATLEDLTDYAKIIKYHKTKK